MARIILLGALLAAAIYAVPMLLAAFRELDGAKRRRLGRAALALLAAAIVILVLARFGLQWIGVVGGAAWAVVRTLVPWLLRLLPLSQRFRTWRQRVGSGPHEQSTQPHDLGRESGAQGMSHAEALDALGLEAGASKEQILVAYRNLIRKVHPDIPGGSSYLASKLNHAKDVLLKGDGADGPFAAG